MNKINVDLRIDIWMEATIISKPKHYLDEKTIIEQENISSL